MDSYRFDDLTRTLATTTTRRGFLKTLAGGAAGALLATFGVGEAAAKDCKKAGQKCDGKKNCCNGLSCKNGTCVRVGTPYRCLCEDRSFQDTCSTRPCPSSIREICIELCKNHGGFFRTPGSCSPEECIL